jgi:hypothetical protein
MNSTDMVGAVTARLQDDFPRMSSVDIERAVRSGAVGAFGAGLDAGAERIRALVDLMGAGREYPEVRLEAAPDEALFLLYSFPPPMFAELDEMGVDERQYEAMIVAERESIMRAMSEASYAVVASLVAAA